MYKLFILEKVKGPKHPRGKTPAAKVNQSCKRVAPGGYRVISGERKQNEGRYFVQGKSLSRERKEKWGFNKQDEIHVGRSPGSSGGGPQGIFRFWKGVGTRVSQE